MNHEAYGLTTQVECLVSQGHDQDRKNNGFCGRSKSKSHEETYNCKLQNKKKKGPIKSKSHKL